MLANTVCIIKMNSKPSFKMNLLKLEQKIWGNICTHFIYRYSTSPAPCKISEVVPEGVMDYST